MKTERISLFKPFESMEQGLLKMLPIIEKVKNSDVKTELLVFYGCIIETHNERVREELAKEEVL
jgi:hypothetical protein